MSHLADSNYNPQNIFARILRGELPCIKLYEDEQTLAFMDIMPQVDGHVLVIPKEAAVTLPELSDEAAAACMRTVKKLSVAVQAAMQSPGVVVLQLNGADAGQTVPHVHFHLIPAALKTLMREHASQMEDPEKLKAIAARILSKLEG